MFNNFQLTSAPSVDNLTKVGDTGEFFAIFIELITKNCVEHGIEPSLTSTIAGEIICQLSFALSGETFYISRKPAILARQMAMYADLQTMPHYDVDKKYGVSRGYSLTIAKKIDDLRKHRDQLRLF